MHRTLSSATLVLLVGLTIVLLFRNGDYYSLSEQERPFHPRYEELRPSGFESHGLGILGSSMIIIGVLMYSTRKRVRRFRFTGKASVFLQVHIALCSIGPLLVFFHSTFKFGGFAGISFWSMAVVVASGIVGRYLYAQIPKGIQDNDLTHEELDSLIGEIAQQLQTDFHLSPGAVQSLDVLVTLPASSRATSFLKGVRYALVDDFSRRRKVRSWARAQASDLSHQRFRQLLDLLDKRLLLIRKRIFLDRMHRVFNYWHVMHLPFAIIMLIAFIVHVGVAIAFGYTWIWQI